MRLVAIHNGSKWTISTNGGLGQQMVSKSNNGWCANEALGPQGSRLQDPTLMCQ